mgnify:CR=1 FL=1|jgi:hypothetical protein
MESFCWMRKFPKEFYVINFGLGDGKMERCERCLSTDFQDHGNKEVCRTCGCVRSECCQGENIFHSPPADPADSVDDEDLPI